MHKVLMFVAFILVCIAWVFGSAYEENRELAEARGVMDQSW